MSTGMVWPMLPAWCWARGLLWMERLLCYGVLCRLGLVLVRGSSVTEKGRKLSRSDQLSSDIDDEVESEEVERPMGKIGRLSLFDRVSGKTMGEMLGIGTGSMSGIASGGVTCEGVECDWSKVGELGGS